MGLKQIEVREKITWSSGSCAIHLAVIKDAVTTKKW